jgi:hypothetical protein
MKFAIDHRFAASMEQLEHVLFAPSLYEALERGMPGIERIEPLERVDEGGVVRRRVRYTPRVGDKIPAFGRAVVKPSMLQWVEESTYDRARHRFDYRIVPNLPEAWRDRFRSSGCYELRTVGEEVARHIDGDIDVRVPLLGRTVEKLLVREITDNFRAEAAILLRLLMV